MAEQAVGGDIVLYIKRGIGPSYAFEYEGCAEVDDVDLAPGEFTPITCKSNIDYRKTVVIDIAEGEAGMPTSAIRILWRQARWLMEQTKACPMTVDLRFGLCGMPSDPEDWSEIVRFNLARVQASSINTGAGQTDKVLVQAAVAGQSYNAVYSLTLDAVDVGSEPGLDCVLVIPRAMCSGDCGPGFEVCDYVFVATEGEYLDTAEVVYTADGGSNWTAMATSPFAAGESISCMVGDVRGSGAGTSMRLVVFRGTTDGANPAECAITTDWGATWNNVDIGAVNGQWITSAFRRGRKIWVGTNDGYIYYSADFGNTWAAQHSATAITNDVNRIHMYSDSLGMAVCNSDEGVYTTDGSTWAALGDVVAAAEPDLTAIWMLTEWVAFAGTRTGYVYYTEDRGVTWTQLQNIGSPIYKIQMWTDTLGFLIAGNTIYRTVDGVTFTEEETPTAAILRDMDLCSPNAGWAVGQTAADADLAVHFQPQPATPIF